MGRTAQPSRPGLPAFGNAPESRAGESSGEWRDSPHLPPALVVPRRRVWKHSWTGPLQDHGVAPLPGGRGQRTCSFINQGKQTWRCPRWPLPGVPHSSQSSAAGFHLLLHSKGPWQPSDHLRGRRSTSARAVALYPVSSK